MNLNDTHGVAPSLAPQPVAWLDYDEAQAQLGQFPWMLMVNQDHPLVKAKTSRMELHAAGVKGGGDAQP